MPATRQAMERFLEGYAGGKTLAQACSLAERSLRTYYDTWLKDSWFTTRKEEAEARRDDVLRGKKGEKLGFEDFRRIVLGRLTYPHMQQWLDWFETDDNDHILILCPPESAKTTFVLDYILWLIYINPNIRIGYVSKSLPHAQKQVAKVKNTIQQNQAYQALCGVQMVPGPGDPHPWTNTHFTVAARQWTVGEDEADYTLNSFGSGSQITGSRFDLLIFDDPDDVNLGRSDRESIWNVILQAGESRLGTAGRMIVIGNRQDEEDVYRMIIDQWADEPDLWAVYLQKAIQDEDTKLVLWPEKFGRSKSVPSTKPVDPKDPWTSAAAFEFFDKKRRRLGHRFHLIYQNDPLADREKDFTREMVDGALDNTLMARRVPPGSVVVATMDPAPVGPAAWIAYALCPPDKNGRIRRVVVDMEWGNNWRTTGTWERIRHVVEKYHPRYFVFERSATTRFLLDDPELTGYLQRHGCYLHEVYTGRNKDYGDFAVSALRELFMGDPITLVLPGATPADEEITKPLRDQLVDYHPGTTAPHDAPMALWFAERCIRDLHLARRFAPAATTMGHWKSPYGQSGAWSGGSWSFGKPGSATIGPQPESVKTVG